MLYIPEIKEYSYIKQPSALPKNIFIYLKDIYTLKIFIWKKKTST